MGWEELMSLNHADGLKFLYLLGLLILGQFLAIKFVVYIIIGGFLRDIRVFWMYKNRVLLFNV